MDRRNFLRAILGTAAATALPSEVWPFRKIFLPAQPKLVYQTFQDLSFLEAPVLPDYIFTPQSLLDEFAKCLSGAYPALVNPVLEVRTKENSFYTKLEIDETFRVGNVYRASFRVPSKPKLTASYTVTEVDQKNRIITFGS